MAQWPEALEEFRQVYNDLRPHEALAIQRPRQRYRISARSYPGQVREWECPEGSEVRRLNPAGSLDCQEERWLVREALSGWRFRLERVGQPLLVSYQHLYVQGIDRR